MKLDATLQRWISAGLLATAVTLTFAQTAAADAPWRRFKGDGPWNGGRDRGRGSEQRGWVHERHEYHGNGGALAGLVGGFILGSAFSHTHPVIVHERYCAPAPRVVYHERYAAPPPVQYRYYDSYCDTYFDTIAECTQHCDNHRHPQLIRVINDDGECIRTLHMTDGRWYGDSRDEEEWDDN